MLPWFTSGVKRRRPCFMEEETWEVRSLVGGGGGGMVGLEGGGGGRVTDQG